MNGKKILRQILTAIVVLIVIAGLIYAFWPQPMLVDIGTVARGHMMLTINEEARTRVREAYIVSAPVSGNLMRVSADSGDRVIQGETVVARITPNAPPALDARQRLQAKASADAAEAAVQAARADLERIKAENNLAQTELQRSRKLIEDGAAPEARLDKALKTAEASEASLRKAEAAVRLRLAELENAKAALVGIENAGGQDSDYIEIKAPVSGKILVVMQESATVITAGTPILQIGDVGNDLEVLVELLSTDAVKVQPGSRVIIEDWGGETPLNGVIDRIEPFAFQDYSALGVKEQRVNTIVKFADDQPEVEKLGHGYRVEVCIVIWEDDDAVIVPSSALFRQEEQWSVFVVDQNEAVLRSVTIENNNGTQANVLEGLEPGDRVVLYPPSDLENGTKVTQR